ncbi:DUF5011 domain-containing protein, partial [bacterium]|nr:DUF5011 domain-containing protein [bacterium]
MDNRSKKWCAMLWLLCLLFLQVQGDSELSRAGIVSGGEVASAGKYRVLTSIGQPYATVTYQSDTRAGEAGLLAGLENPLIADTAGTINAVENELLVLTHAQLLSLLNAYDPDGDAITATVEALAGTIIGVTGAGSLVLNEGESLGWQPPLNKTGEIEAIRVKLHENRLAKEIEALITVNINDGVDSVPPVLTLQGGVEVTIPQGATYVDAGASAMDNLDGNLTTKIVVSGAVDTSTLGTYTLKYDVSDAAGNAAESVSRKVVVEQQASVTQTLSLVEGWSLISIYVEADSMTPAKLFEPVKESLLTIKDATGLYDPDIPEFLNTIKHIRQGRGYWIKMKKDRFLNVKGSTPKEVVVNLRGGWNLVGHPVKVPIAPSEIFKSIINDVEIVKSLTRSYNPTLPAFLNTLIQMEAGKGYWVKMKRAAALKFGAGNSGLRAFTKMATNMASDGVFGQIIVSPNVSATVLAQVTVEGEAVSSGSVVGAFVGDELRGQHEVVQADGN